MARISTFALLLLATLVPTTALEVLYGVRLWDMLGQQMRTATLEQAGFEAAAIEDRLRSADGALLMIDAALRTSDAGSASLKRYAEPHFAAVAYVDPATGPRQIYGPQLAIPELSDTARVRLEQGDPLVLSAPANGAVLKVLLVRAARPPARPRGALLVAELDANRLWRGMSSLADGMVVCVLDGGRNPLFCSTAHGGSGVLDAQRGDNSRVSGDSRLLWEPRFHAAEWTVVASLPGRSLTEHVVGALPVYVCVLALAAVISALIAVALPAGAPAAAHDPVPDGLSAFVPLDRHSPPSPAQSAQRQRETMAALSEIDHAILSRASRDRIVEMVLRKSSAIIGAEVLGIAVLGSASDATMRVSVRGQKSTQAPHRTTMDAEELEFLSAETNGCWIEDLAAYPWLAPLASCGARRALLLPVFVDAELTAVISIGLIDHDDLPDDARTYARDFADRLGVALTATTRDEHLYIESHFDPVTTLPNRHFLKDRISEEISRAQREHRKLAVIFVNLDEFKRVNAVGGLAGGDAVLQQAARRLKRCLREEDVLGRFSGDEFVTLLPAVPSGLEAGKVAEKLLSLLSQPFTLGGQEYHLGASMGICIYPNDGDSADKLLRNANCAMARAKANGRGQYVFFEEQLNAVVHERTTIERDIRHAIGNNELVVFYQPQIELRSGKLVAAEALLRWQHPKRGMVSPEKFISVCEQSKLIDLIGEHVRSAAGAQYGAWEGSGTTMTRVAVNVSSQELKGKDFVTRIETMLRETALRPFCLELEVTESVLVDKSANVLGGLRRLHEKGVRIAIDDFGTGFSSLAYLKQLPFDMLKIDRAFTRGIGTNDGSDEIVGAIVSMAHSLGKEVVAEGVETEQQLHFLEQKGCEVGQGYLWSKAVSAADFEKFARDWKPAPRQRVLRGVEGKKAVG